MGMVPVMCDSLLYFWTHNDLEDAMKLKFLNGLFLNDCSLDAGCCFSRIDVTPSYRYECQVALRQTAFL